MRSEVYNFLVNKRPGICYRYHKVHDGRQVYKNNFMDIFTVAECSITMYFSAIFWGKLQKLIFMKKSDYLLKSVNLKRIKKKR